MTLYPREDQKILIDLFCGVGGATKGYQEKGFHVIGVDINAQPDYCGDEFIQADALEYIKEWGRIADVIHASPPCQASSALSKGTNKGRKYINLIPETREALSKFEVPTIMENVQGSDLRRDLTLCGEMFSLSVIRHRYFELNNFTYATPEHKKHRGRTRGWRHGIYYDGPYLAVYGQGGGKGTIKEWQDAMQIDWTNNRKSIAEAIPPAYSEYIAQFLGAE